MQRYAKLLNWSNACNYFLQVMVDILSFDNINKFFDLTQSDDNINSIIQLINNSKREKSN